MVIKKINDLNQGVLYFPNDVYHMFDFMGTGDEQVITFGRGVMRIYGSKTAVHTGKDRKAELIYLQKNVANHTRY